MPLSNVAHNPQAVWEALQAGNQRVIDGTIMDLNKIYEREGLTKGQDPRVVVLACSDSRAPIEHIFNIGFGDAFVIRTAGGQAPHPDVDFPELSSTGLLLSSLKPADRALLPEDTPDREVSIDLGGQMMPYEWSILTDGQSSSATVQEGQRLRMVMRNRTMMPHPMHIHGHTWALPGSGGLRKDTVLLRHGETMIADLIADNPGEWAFHCHNAYHLETGMFSSLRYE